MVLERKKECTERCNKMKGEKKQIKKETSPKREILKERITTEMERKKDIMQRKV